MILTLNRIGGVIALLSLTACASGSVSPDHINDPFEPVNRGVHEFNKLVDVTVLAPVSNVYGTIVPVELRDAVDNGANNLDLPGQAVNHVLQGNLEDAVVTLVRFGLNSTLGLLGALDPASELGLFEAPTDFGETLDVYGFAEGPYIELPFFGGSTVRDTIGMAVDFAIDPLRQIVPSPEHEYLFALKGLDIVGDRHTYSDLVDVLLYESSDSYAAQRLTYLQNRRHTIVGETVIEELEDPFAFDY